MFFEAFLRNGHRDTVAETKLKNVWKIPRPYPQLKKKHPPALDCTGERLLSKLFPHVF